MAEFNLMTWDAQWESETLKLQQYIDTLPLKGAMIKSVAFLGKLFNQNEFTDLAENVNGRWAMLNEPVIFTLILPDRTTDFEILFNSICGLSFDAIADDTQSKYTGETRSNFASTIFNPIIGLKIDKVLVKSSSDPMNITHPESITITFTDSKYYLEINEYSGAYMQIFLKDDTNKTVKL